MSTPNQTPDRTGITQPLSELITAVRALSPEKHPAAQAKITAALGNLQARTHQEAGRILVPTDIPTDTAPFSSREQLLDKLSSQYDSNFTAWKSTFQLNAKDLQTLATKDTVMKWAATVTTETITSLSKYGEPRLKLLSALPVQQLMEIIDQHKTIPGQTDGKIWWDQWKKIAAKPGSFGLTVDTEDMPFDAGIYYIDPVKEDKSRTNEAMVNEYEQKFITQGLSGSMPQDAWVPSVMDAMTRRQVYDRQYVTVFSRPQGTGGLPYAYWDGDHVYLGKRDPDFSFGYLRCRPWVGGVKKN